MATSQKKTQVDIDELASQVESEVSNQGMITEDTLGISNEAEEVEAPKVSEVVKEEVKTPAVEAKKEKPVVKSATLLALEAQPKIQVFVPLTFGGSKKDMLDVLVNGEKFQYARGSYHAVPETIADIIKEHLNQDSSEADDKRIEGDLLKEKALTK